MLPYGRDMFDLDVSPDGKTLTAAMAGVTGQQRLVRMAVADLEAGRSDFEVLYEFAGNSPANFVFSPDGRYLYGTSYYSGVSNIFRYNFGTKEMDTVTNGITGLFRPVPISDDSLIAFNYTAKGFIPVMLPNGKAEDVNAIRFLGQAILEDYPVVKDWTLGSPAAVDLEALNAQRGEYKSAQNLKFVSAYPILAELPWQHVPGHEDELDGPRGHRQARRLGLGEPQPGGRRRREVPPHGRLPPLGMGGERHRQPRRLLRLLRSHQDEPEGVFPLRGVRRASSSPTGPAPWTGGSRWPATRASTPCPTTRTWRPRHRSSGPPAPASGTATTARRSAASNPRRASSGSWTRCDNVVKGKHYPRIWGTAAVGIYLPWEHSSLWLHAAAGKSWGDPPGHHLELLLRGVREQLGRPRGGQPATGTTTASRASTSTRWAAPTSARRCWSGGFRPYGSTTSASPSCTARTGR